VSPASVRTSTRETSGAIAPSNSAASVPTIDRLAWTGRSGSLPVCGADATVHGPFDSLPTRSVLSSSRKATKVRTSSPNVVDRGPLAASWLLTDPKMSSQGAAGGNRSVSNARTASMSADGASAK
jgi:hypothetical protein